MGPRSARQGRGDWWLAEHDWLCCLAVAANDLVRGDTAEARTQLEALAADPGWPSFGVIAAEAELAR